MLCTIAWRDLRRRSVGAHVDGARIVAALIEALETGDVLVFPLRRQTGWIRRMRRFLLWRFFDT